jgi:DNA invertase Pin-like site-specific DNA recombinase
MRAVIYAAKSTEDKHGSIPTQLEDCRTMADREGWEVVGEFFDEAFSAYHGNRGPGLAAAKAKAIEHAPCVLVAQDADRFARGAGDAPGAADHLGELFFVLRRQRVAIWTVRSRELDPIRAALEGERANDETERKAQAVKAGVQRSRAKGNPWGIPRTGYRAVPKVVDGEVVRSRVIDPDEAEIVQAIFDELDTGASVGDVARTLNARGYLTRHGVTWDAKRVRSIAENPVYKGEDGHHPQIIDVALWDRVAEKIARTDYAAMQERKGGRQPTRDFMLRKLAVCAECGEPMYSIVEHGRRVYKCKAVHRCTGACYAQLIPADLAEQRIFDHFAVLIGDCMENWIGERLSERDSERSVLQRAADAERAKLAKLDQVREQRMAELEKVGFNAIALEVIERIDQQREAVRTDIEDAEARLAEWTAVGPDDAMAYLTRIVDQVEGRIARAEGIRELNAALRDVLNGVVLGYDGETLTADLRLTPSGFEACDSAIAELFEARLPGGLDTSAASALACPGRPGPDRTSSTSYIAACSTPPRNTDHGDANQPRQRRQPSQNSATPTSSQPRFDASSPPSKHVASPAGCSRPRSRSAHSGRTPRKQATAPCPTRGPGDGSRLRPCRSRLRLR